MDKVTNDRSAFDKILEAIPGYKGYRDLQNRRDADKIQREFLARRLEEGKGIIDDIKSATMDGGDLSALGPLESLQKMVDHQANRVRYAAYGASGLLDAVQVTASDLEKIHEFDLSLIEAVDSILSTLAELQAGEGRNLGEGIKKARGILEKFAKHFDQREKMLKGVQ